MGGRRTAPGARSAVRNSEDRDCRGSPQGGGENVVVT